MWEVMGGEKAPRTRSGPVENREVPFSTSSFVFPSQIVSIQRHEPPTSQRVGGSIDQVGAVGVALCLMPCGCGTGLAVAVIVGNS
jgi:hypothetical protein